ncbi:homeodomain-interacting protein kinase 2-like [Centropristis striata]|uniref:homeodomain-interacting protein kinase 2-like n=1 Tax=Centropristis striata TaxID=184440 RepID=UPI0027DF31F5|nr:homeodomain-interacting protein kinase 2-like [Centropristis striata]
MPPDHLLDKGQKTARYFTKTECNSWRLKTHQEYWQDCPHRQYQTEVCLSLDKLRLMRLERKNKSEAVERKQCIDLLEAMLNLDEAERITPIGILTHPFIAKGQKRSK